MEDITPFRETTAAANGINNLTHVVGYLNGMKDYEAHAFYWDSMSTLVRLDEASHDPEAVPPYCGSGAEARAINDDGVIAGVRRASCNPAGTRFARAAQWANFSAPWREIVPLGHGPKSNYAYNINAGGTIVGSNHDGYVGTAAFQWNEGASDVPLPAVTAPELPDSGSIKALGNNVSNGIVGSLDVRLSSGDWVGRAFYWNGSSTESRLLPSLTPYGESLAYEINKEGFSVGYSEDPRDRLAVVWHSHFGIKTLPLPPGAGTDTVFVNYRCEARAVNERSATGVVQAVGFCNVGGNRHAMVWIISTYKYEVPPDSP
jgi:uncharacterized membrane protein